MRFLSGCCAHLLMTLHHLFQHFLMSPLHKAYYQLTGSFQTLFPFQRNLASKIFTFLIQSLFFQSLARSSRDIYINSYWTISIQRACSLMLSLVFCKHCSTVIPLLTSVHKRHQILDKQQKVACIFFDVKKVFDGVPHYSLLMKLTEFIYSLEMGEKLLVKSPTACGSWWWALQLASCFVWGSPGSILGPLLFLVYMNDLVNVSLSQGCEIVMFGDDILMFKLITGDEDLADIDRTSNWMSANHLCLNP